jgi:hypothetical protein
MSSNKEAIDIATKPKPMKTHSKTLLARDDNRHLKETGQLT